MPAFTFLAGHGSAVHRPPCGGMFATPLTFVHPDEANGFSDAEFASKKRLSRRDRFLAEVEAATPCAALAAALSQSISPICNRLQKDLLLVLVVADGYAAGLLTSEKGRLHRPATRSSGKCP